MATVGKINICNQAIHLVSGQNIISFDDTSVEARVCDEAYPTVLEATLKGGDWSFATKVVELTSPLDPSSPNFNGSNTWGNCFQLPDSLLRVIKTRHDGNFKILSDDHEVIFDTICVHHNSTWIKYIFKNGDHSQFDGDFVTALVYGMAVRLAVPVAASATLQDRMVTLYEMNLTNARANDGRQSTNERVRASWLTKGGRRSQLGGRSF